MERLEFVQYLDTNIYNVFCEQFKLSMETRQELGDILKHIDVSCLVPSNLCNYINSQAYCQRMENLDIETSTSISVVYILKNEETLIKKSIESILTLADEIIILDTGSTDSTINEILSLNSKKIKILTDEWHDDFSEARNIANNAASSDWILTFDADYTIDFQPMNLKKVLTFLNNFIEVEECVFNLSIIDAEHEYKSGKLIKNTRKFSYRGRVHETYIRIDSNLHPIRINLDFKLISQRRVNCQKKQYYNQLLLKTIADYPEDQRWCFIYLRDNFRTIEVADFEKIVNKYLFIKSNGILNVSNLKIDEYTNALLALLLEKYLECGKLNSFAKYLSIAKEITDNMDFFYLEYMYNEIKIKREHKELLDRFLIRYENDPKKGEVFDEDCLNSLFGLLLLDNDYVSSARKVLSEVYEKKPNLGIFSSNFVKEILRGKL